MPKWAVVERLSRCDNPAAISGGTHVVGGTTWENSLRRCTRRYSSQRDEVHHTRGDQGEKTRGEHGPSGVVAVVALRQPRRDSGGTPGVGETTYDQSVRCCTRRYSSQRDEFHHTRGTKEKRRE